ncbi:MAG: hypothetical protein WCC38_00735 [Pseudonocardiaceae bacterium]
MRVSEVFTMGASEGRRGGYSDGGTNEYQNYYYDYENEGYYNNNYSGFERGPTRRSLLGLLG